MFISKFGLTGLVLICLCTITVQGRQKQLKFVPGDIKTYSGLKRESFKVETSETPANDGSRTLRLKIWLTRLYFRHFKPASNYSIFLVVYCKSKVHLITKTRLGGLGSRGTRGIFLRDTYSNRGTGNQYAVLDVPHGDKYIGYGFYFRYFTETKKGKKVAADMRYFPVRLEDPVIGRRKIIARPKARNDCGIYTIPILIPKASNKYQLIIKSYIGISFLDKMRRVHAVRFYIKNSTLVQIAFAERGKEKLTDRRYPGMKMTANLRLLPSSVVGQITFADVLQVVGKVIIVGYTGWFGFLKFYSLETKVKWGNQLHSEGSKNLTTTKEKNGYDIIGRNRDKISVVATKLKTKMKGNSKMMAIAGVVAGLLVLLTVMGICQLKSKSSAASSDEEKTQKETERASSSRKRSHRERSSSRKRRKRREDSEEE